MQAARYEDEENMSIVDACNDPRMQPVVVVKKLDEARYFFYLVSFDCSNNNSTNYLRTLFWDDPLTAGSGVERRNLLRFVAKCHKGTGRCPSCLLAYVFLSVSVVRLTRATFCIVLFVCSVSWLFLLGCQYHCK